MKFIIVESPTKARTLSKFLGSDYIVDSTKGHIMDLPKSKLSIDIENDFLPDYQPIDKKKSTIADFFILPNYTVELNNFPFQLTSKKIGFSKNLRLQTYFEIHSPPPEI